MRFQEIQISIYGGSPGVRDLGLVESALMAAQQTFDSHDLYPTVPDKTAALWHGLVSNHAFVDGNKRIGLMVSAVFLSVNGYDLMLTSNEVESITMDLAQSVLSRQQLADILAEQAIPKKYSN